ncbi:copper resistance system multicopper oxidase [Marinivivus vitaminiproducens]|uniref:copper resistance system multicopper oxidase n=1 Tax=Marinivivus vitaminiproducens TaxID=3035935 RepID=UPI0027A0CB77|nr:copper resistance system multicopper oxidase [Geminicoccaceae bacterium SCSIO 64248]
MSKTSNPLGLSRRRALQLSAAAGVVSVFPGRRVFAQAASTYDLVIDRQSMMIDGHRSPAITLNGSVPGPTLRFIEGGEAIVYVRNNLSEDASIHWHGLLIDPAMDGVPGFNGYTGIPAGGTFTYRFDLRQAGTYWYHSHSGFQEQAGLYGSLVIESNKREPFRYDRDYVLVLSDHTDEDPSGIFQNLKTEDGYYNYRKQTLFDFFQDAREQGFGAAWDDRMAWGSMRMDKTDLADVTGYSFLVNGKGPKDNWTGLFTPGERVRLRFINASAMSIFDVRIPDLPMTVVAADGLNVRPVKINEFRIGTAETYDVIVLPEERPYTIMSEPIDRTGYARATLATAHGMEAPIPALRPRTLLTMNDMGMAMGGMDHGSMAGMEGMDHGSMAGMDHSKMGGMSGMNHGAPVGGNTMSNPDAPDAVANPPSEMTDSMGGMDRGARERASANQAAVGWADAGTLPGEKALAYADLRSVTTNKDTRPPTKDIEIRLDGNMERYIWALNGERYAYAEPIRVAYGDRVRLRLVNTTMMAHPMHLHGMFVELEDDTGANKALKHTVLVPPGKEVSVLLTADEPGEWPLHCHLLYHMAAGMMARFIVESKTASL